MRIISGRFKGKKLLLPKDKNTRPLKDLVKESIFNLLEHSKQLSLKIWNFFLFLKRSRFFSKILIASK